MKTRSLRVVKNYVDDELEIVKCDDKQWQVEEFYGKSAGWWPLKQFDTESEAATWMTKELGDG